MLFSTGLVAGGALTGVLIAALQGIPKESDGKTISLADWVLDSVGVRGFEHAGMAAEFIALAAFGALCVWLLQVAKQKE